MLIKKLGSFFLEVLQVVVFAVSIFLFIYLLVLQPHKIKGNSMEPNFHDGEFLLTDKVTYRFGDPQRGDVVVFKAPPDYTDEYIKRVIGIPGDEVRIQNGNVFVNGIQLDETYIPDTVRTQSSRFATEGKAVVVPEESLFVMGDNRDHSLDSRSFGFIEYQFISGRAWLVYWPVADAGFIEPPEY